MTILLAQVTGLGEESQPFAGWEQEDEAGGEVAPAAGALSAGPRHASIGTEAMGEGDEGGAASAGTRRTAEANGGGGGAPHANGNGNGNGVAAAAQPLDADGEARLASFLSRAMGNMGIGGEFDVGIGGGPGSAASLLGIR